MIIEGVLIGHVVLEHWRRAVVAIAAFGIFGQRSAQLLRRLFLAGRTVVACPDAKSVAHQKAELIPVHWCSKSVREAARHAEALGDFLEVALRSEDGFAAASYQREKSDVSLVPAARIAFRTTGLKPHTQTRYSLGDVAAHVGRVGPGGLRDLLFGERYLEGFSIDESRAGNASRNEFLGILPIGERRVLGAVELQLHLPGMQIVCRGLPVQLF